jgi:carbon-monoxide dehydrogenase large subunit
MGEGGAIASPAALANAVRDALAPFGAIASPAALANAVRDALAPFGARVTTQPLTPERILGLIGEAGGGRPGRPTPA